MEHSYRYDGAFFDYIDRGARRSARFVVERIAAALKPRSLLDVGCGRGVWAAEWLKAGVSDCIGVDGDYVDRRRLAIPAERFVARDLAQPIDLGRRFDLVQSFETAEHIDPAHAESFVASLCRHGSVVLFSAAVPGQGGESHVNEQRPDYWCAKFRAQGFSAYDWVRPLIAPCREVEPWYRYNSLLYASGEAEAALPPEVRKARLAPGAPVPDVAPLGWRMRNACLRHLPAGIVQQLAIVKHKALNLVASGAGPDGP